MKRNTKGIMGKEVKECEVYKCKNKAYDRLGGCVSCKKHYKNDLIRLYGDLETAKRYVRKP